MNHSNSTPINKTAALVTSNGTRFNHELTDHAKTLYWQAPREMTSYDEVLVDLTGVKFGRFTVIGFLGGKSWQVRCSCGLYASRRRKAILNPKNSIDACKECMNMAYIKRNYHYQKTGMNKPLEEFM